jgi:hypothetical protein
MAFTLAKLSAWRNSHDPTPSPSPPPDPVRKLVRTVEVPDARGDARRSSFTLDPLPANGRARELGERRIPEWGTT